MTYVLDTHPLIWFFEGNARLSLAVRTALPSLFNYGRFASVLLVLLSVAGCEKPVPPSSITGAYSVLNTHGGAILVIKDGGVFEEAFIRRDTGSVERVTGQWKYAKGDLWEWRLSLTNAIFPLFGQQTGVWSLVPEVSHGIDTLPLNPDEDIALRKIPPALPGAVRKSGDSDARAIPGTNVALEGNYVAAVDKGIEVLRLSKGGEYFRDRVSYPLMEEAHWRGQWTTKGNATVDLGNETAASPPAPTETPSQSDPFQNETEKLKRFVDREAGIEPSSQRKPSPITENRSQPASPTSDGTSVSFETRPESFVTDKDDWGVYLRSQDNGIVFFMPSAVPWTNYVFTSGWSSLKRNSEH